MARIFRAGDADLRAASGLAEGDDAAEIEACGGWVPDVGQVVQ